MKNHLIFLKDVDKFALQNALKDLDATYKNFFESLAKYPKFKRKRSKNQSYITNLTKNNIEMIGDAMKRSNILGIWFRG